MYSALSVADGSKQLNDISNKQWEQRETWGQTRICISLGGVVSSDREAPRIHQIYFW